MNGTPQLTLDILLPNLLSSSRELVTDTIFQITMILQKSSNAEDAPSQITKFLSENLKTISLKTIIKLLSKILKLAKDESTILNVRMMKTLFPFVISLIQSTQYSIEEYSSLSLLLGKITIKSGAYSSSLIEANIDSIFNKFKNAPKGYFGSLATYSKYAMLCILIELTKNSPVVTYNKFIETFSDFVYVVKNMYKDDDENVRYALSELVKQFLLLLSNRDNSIKETYTNKIYNVFKDNITSGYTDGNIVHGTILMLKAVSVRKEFFNEKYRLVLDYLYSYIKTQIVIVVREIISSVPYFANYSTETFEKYSFGIFSSFFIKLYVNTKNITFKNDILLSLGRLSNIISEKSFAPFAGEIVAMIKNDFMNEKMITREAVGCLGALLKNYSELVLEKISFSEMLSKVFVCGFYDSHILFLDRLLEVYDENSPEKIQIIVISLNVISLILCGKKFMLKDTINSIRTIASDKKIGRKGSRFGSQESIHSGVTEIKKQSTFSSSTRFRKISSPSKTSSSSPPTNLLVVVGKAISTYIITDESNRFHKQVLILLQRNALTFLNHITHPFFSKDILTFYTRNCIKYLSDIYSPIIHEVISLGSAKWITPSDNECIYMLKTILDSLLNLLLNPHNDEIRLLIVKALDSRYDDLLVNEDFFAKLTFTLTYTDIALREEIVKILSRLLAHNYTIVMYFIKRSLMEIFNTLEAKYNMAEKEDAIVLLRFYVKHANKYIIEYLYIIFDSLISILKSSLDESSNSDSSLEEASYQISSTLKVNILHIICDLLEIHSKVLTNESYTEILNICIENLKEISVNSIVEISLKSILAVLEYSNVDFNVYFNFTELINILIKILIRNNSKNIRLYAMKIFGFIGTMDPDKLEVLWSIHKNDDGNNTEDYEADEYENFDDEEIVYHNREQVKKNRKGNINLIQMLSRNKKNKLLNDKNQNSQLNSCAYHVVTSLMNVLNDDSQQEISSQVLVIIDNILNYFKSSNLSKNNGVIELMLSRLIDLINEYPTQTQLKIFDCILFIIKNFECSREHLNELVNNVIEKYIDDVDTQERIFQILIELLQLYLPMMEKYFNRLIPMLLSMLRDNTDTERLWYIRQKVFMCFTAMSDKLNNYLGEVVAEIVSLLNSSMVLANFNSKMVDNNSSSRTVQKREDMEIFVLLERIISLDSFREHLPKIVKVLMQYINYSPDAKELIMGLFMKMMKYCHGDFLSFLPNIIRVAKENSIDILDYFNEIQREIERCNGNSLYNLKVSTSKKFVTMTKSVSSNVTNEDDEESVTNTRLANINTDEVLSEFNPVNCSIEEDWREWFKSSSKQLFLNSPSYLLYCCRNLSELLITDLYNDAFINIWSILSPSQKDKMIGYLKTALSASTAPNEILLVILNLSEYIEREESHIDFIDLSTLAVSARECNAYAKELYYTENEYKNSENVSSLESLITLYYELNLPESAMGILSIAQKKNKNIKEDDLYLKLHRYKEALDVINRKREIKDEKYNPNLIKGSLICLDGLSDWEEMIKLGEDIEKYNDSLVTELSPLFARASLNLNQWEKLKKYTEKFIPNDEEENEYEKNFFQAVIAVKEKDYKKAKEYIDLARDAIDDKIKTLLSESYERAYKLLLSNEHLYQLEEIIKLNNTKENYETAKKELKARWDDRLEMISSNGTKAYERILAIRGLVFPIEEDYDKHLDLAKIYRKDDHFGQCMNILQRLRKPLENNKAISLDIELSLSKCLNENESLRDTEKAMENLSSIIKTGMSNVLNDKLKSKIYCYYAYLSMKDYSKEERVKEALENFELSTKYNSKNYKAWHYYGLLNYKYFELLSNSNNSNRIIYAKNAINGFTNSVVIGGKIISKILQDLLRLIDVWFRNEDKSVIEMIMPSFKLISMDAWLLVMPQLLARVNVKNALVRDSLVEILKQIGLMHPTALVYPLVVMHKSKNTSTRSITAGVILNHMSEKYSKLIKECEIIIDELNRCALLLHEKWMEAIDESCKLYFDSNDINGMLSVLHEVHEKMNERPETMNEIHFHQFYSGELSEAKSLLDDYKEFNNEGLIKQAWDIYHGVYLNIRDNFKDFDLVDLENVSPLLANFKQSEICVPGLNRSDIYPVVKIAGFDKKMNVLSSKQRPRSLKMFGSDGKEYMFLLKGHEDLRQDERAMQLFGLVNALLSSDVDTCDKNLFIKRFPVIALSNNTGLLGWVPNCDTLSYLIKEYRASNKIYKNIEFRLLENKYPKFSSACFLNKLEVFKFVVDNTSALDIYKILWIKSKNSEDWLDRRTNYSRSLAVMSMVGYILGLGDRHPSNLMLDRKSGKILHIDFGDCFEVAMKREKFPEKVPFRLTRMLIKALEVSGIEGTFSITCSNVMRVLRSNRDSLIALLAAFVHDPLISFRFLVPLMLKQTKKPSNVFHQNAPNTSKSLKERGIDEVILRRRKTAVLTSNIQPRQSKKNLTRKEALDDVGYQKRRMGSVERKLFNSFSERDEVDSELNKIAKIVLGRIIDKLKGTDFSKNETLEVNAQVEKLIKQATNEENLCQLYLGWCPFW